MLLQRFRNFVQRVRDAHGALEDVRQATLRTMVEQLRERRREADPDSLVPFGRKIYSQCDEDGLIQEIFRRVGTTSRAFVEFGVGNGLENNTAALLLAGWQGVWIEGDPGSVESIRRSLAPLVDAGRLQVLLRFVTRENAAELIQGCSLPAQLDLLSIDLDGNDIWVFEAVSALSPRVLVMEYNAKFAPPLQFCMAYDAVATWQGDDCYGASIAFLEERLASHGYRLVGCSLSGTNAFFVRQDLVEGRFAPPYTAERHYEPARHYLCALEAGHAASYRALCMPIPDASRPS